MKEIEILETEKIAEIDMVGNTKKQPCQANQLKNWFFTFNNYTESDILLLKKVFLEICDKYIFQEETGENGTKHLQGTIILHKKMRWTEFNLPKAIHWEKTNNLDKSLLYCCKAETRTGEVFFKGCLPPRKLKIIDTLKNWQTKLDNIIKSEPDDRKIIWVADKEGNNGKTQLAKYFIKMYDACYITEGKKSDIVNIVYNRLLKSDDMGLVILDVPRDNKTVSYKSIEEIKNGIICNTKYETGIKLINSPHVVVFSNFWPDLDKFTHDRWEIYTITKNDLVKVNIKDIQFEEIE